MGDIRFLGPARGGRCIYCHDALSGSVRTCPECSATWHQDCGEGARRCPTTGCSGPAPDAGTRPDTASPRSDDLSPDRPRPGVRARRGPIASLTNSTQFTAFFTIASAIVLLWPIVHWPSFWWVCSNFKGRRGGSAPTFNAVVSLVVAFVTFCVSANWLRRIPGLFREIDSLLDDTRPTAMRLTVYTEGEGKSVRTHARLVAGETSITLPLDGGLPPDWLMNPTAHQDEPVLVYGLPPPGPYLLEFRDGRLALVHPD